ncbi:MAG: ketopantoate reductase family protein [Actinobacteria bacterium]|nr:ketopantoate reductase family protein [Actinomycetota bacterium]
MSPSWLADRTGAPSPERIDDVELADGDVVVLAMKSQDTPAALEQLVAHAPPGVRVVCAQNGVDNERLALRRFEHVYGVCVMLPSSFLEPGVVDAHGAPHNAILDIGRYPSGTDATSEAVAAALRAAHLASESRPDIMRWKYNKLMMNLRNAVDALISDPDNVAPLTDAARAEAEACLRAAGIEKASDDEDRARRSGVMALQPIPGRDAGRGGGSTWQSLARGATSTEVDWLNGEIVLLGRLHGVPTPVNQLLCEVARWALAERLGPRALTTQQVLDRRDAGR